MNSKGLLTLALSVTGAALLFGEAPRLPPAPANARRCRSRRRSTRGTRRDGDVQDRAARARRSWTWRIAAGDAGRLQPPAKDVAATEIPGSSRRAPSGRSCDRPATTATASSAPTRRRPSARAERQQRRAEIGQAKQARRSGTRDTHTGGALSMSAKGNQHPPWSAVCTQRIEQLTPAAQASG